MENNSKLEAFKNACGSIEFKVNGEKCVGKLLI